MTKEQTRMLAFLTEHKGSWVNARELVIATEACAYCRVISELRALGYQIENKVERDGRKTINGFYMLLSERQAVAFALANGKKVTRERIEALDNEPTLFDLKKSHCDEN
jgi:hypothetical protein